VEVSVNAHLKGPLKPTPRSQVLGTAGVPLSITRWTRHPHGESMDAKKIVSYINTSPTNPHWARVVGYGPFSLWVIHKEGLCPSNGDIDRMMMT
jgi:hypothetical protein